MTRSRTPSPATQQVLLHLLRAGHGGAHGYDLSRATGVKAGTLYPMLARLADQGFLESEWQPSPEPGRPPRQVHRLTESGRTFAAALPVLAEGVRATAQPVASR